MDPFRVDEEIESGLDQEIQVETETATDVEYCPHLLVGRLRHTNARIRLDVTPYNPHHGPSVTISHRHFLTCRFIDEANKCYRVFDGIDISLNAYLQHLKRIHQTPLQEYTYNAQVGCLPVSLMHVGYVYKEFIRAMVEFIMYLHSEEVGYTLKSFSINNLVFKGGFLKFWAVEFHDNTESNRKLDFDSLNKVILEIFHDYNKDDLPPDFQDFLDWVQKYQGKEKSYKQEEEFIFHHIGIMSPTQSIQFIKMLFGKQKQLQSPAIQNYRYMITNLPKTGGWIGSNMKWALFKPIHDVFSGGDYIDSNHAMVKFWCHLANHIPEKIPQPYNYSDTDIVLMIMSVFAKEICLFQKHLSDIGILDNFI